MSKLFTPAQESGHPGHRSAEIAAASFSGCIAFVGTGALGSAILHRLQAGEPVWLRSALLIDPDRLEQRNVALSVLFREAVERDGARALQQPKAEVLARVLSFACEAMAAGIADVGWQRLREADLIVCSADDLLARVETAQVARALRLPLVDAGVFGGEALHEAGGRGRVTFYAPEHAAACALCGLQEERRAQVLQFATSRSLGCRPLEKTGSLGEGFATPPAIQAAADLAFDVIQGCMTQRSEASCYRHSWTVRPALGEASWRAPRHRLARSASCPWHEGETGPLIALPDDRSLGETLHEAEAADRGRRWRLQLTWPVCVQARCRACGTAQSTAQRLARVRREGRCERCGAVGAMEPLRSVGSIGVKDPEAALMPRELGLPVRHMLRLRPTLTAGSGR